LFELPQSRLDLAGLDRPQKGVDRSCPEGDVGALLDHLTGASEERLR
jgi:hypothetical protein